MRMDSVLTLLLVEDVKAANDCRVARCEYSYTE